MASWQLAPRQSQPPPYRGQHKYNEKAAPNRSPLIEYRRMRVAVGNGNPRVDKNRPLGADALEALSHKTTDVGQWSDAETLCMNLVRGLDRAASISGGISTTSANASEPELHVDPRVSLDHHKQCFARFNKQTADLLPYYMSKLLDRLLASQADAIARYAAECRGRGRLEKRIATLEAKLDEAKSTLERERAAAKAAQIDPTSEGFEAEPSPLPHFFRRWKAQSEEARDSPLYHGRNKADLPPPLMPTAKDCFEVFCVLTPTEQREVRSLIAETMPPVTPWRLEANQSDAVREARKVLAQGAHAHDVARASLSKRLIRLEPSLAGSPEARSALVGAAGAAAAGKMLHASGALSAR